MANNSYERFAEKSRFYFRNFPYVSYGDNIRIKNFLRRFDFRQRVKKLGSIYIRWLVRDEDTPQVIAHKLYNSTHYYWIVLMINSMHDPVFSFPMAERELSAYVDKKYGEEGKYDTHHYENEKGIIVDKNYGGKTKEINNLEYELRENDRRRKILLLKPEYLEQVLQELEDIFRKK